MSALLPVAQWLRRRVGAAGPRNPTPRWQDARLAIDELTSAYFAALSFEAAQPPGFERLRDLFIAQGQVVDATRAQPQVLDVATSIQRLQARHAEGSTLRSRVLCVSATTEILGLGAQRACMVVREETRQGGAALALRGAVFLQFVSQAESWKLCAATWADQRMGQPWSLHPEVNEFGC
jgi:hypothetical protein